MGIMVDPTALRGNIPQTEDTLVVQDWENYKKLEIGMRVAIATRL